MPDSAGCFCTRYSTLSLSQTGRTGSDHAGYLSYEAALERRAAATQLNQLFRQLTGGADAVPGLHHW